MNRSAETGPRRRPILDNRLNRRVTVGLTCIEPVADRAVRNDGAESRARSSGVARCRIAAAAGIPMRHAVE
jgi:hypothetical protein